MLFLKNNLKIARKPNLILVRKFIKLHNNLFQKKDMAKSYSEKLRNVFFYLLDIRVLLLIALNDQFCANNAKIRKYGGPGPEKTYIFRTPDPRICNFCAKIIILSRFLGNLYVQKVEKHITQLSVIGFCLTIFLTSILL